MDDKGSAVHYTLTLQKSSAKTANAHANAHHQRLYSISLDFTNSEFAAVQKNLRAATVDAPSRVLSRSLLQPQGLHKFLLTLGIDIVRLCLVFTLEFWKNRILFPTSTE